MKYVTGYTDPFLDPQTGSLAHIGQLPSLQYGLIWEGDEDNTPRPSFSLLDIKVDLQSVSKSIKTIFQKDFIVKTPSPLFPNAQALSTLQDGILKNTGGILDPAQLGVAFIGESFGGKIWRGTQSGIPEESDALSEVIFDVTIINARFLAGEFILGDALVQATWPNSQFLVNFPDGIIKKTGGKTLQQAIAGEDYMAPNLTHNHVWRGGADNKPEEIQLQYAPDDAPYILQSPNENLPNAQALTNLVGLEPKMLKAANNGTIEVAIGGTDYVTPAGLDERLLEYATVVFVEEQVGGLQTQITALDATVTTLGITVAAHTLSIAALGLEKESKSDHQADMDAVNAKIDGISGTADRIKVTHGQNIKVDIEENPKLLGNTQITGNADIDGTATIKGDANIIGDTEMTGSATVSGDVKMTGKGALKLPAGTEAERPAALEVGMLRFRKSG